MKKPKCPVCNRSDIHVLTSIFMLVNVILAIVTGSVWLWVGGIVIFLLIERLRPLTKKEEMLIDMTKKFEDLDTMLKKREDA